MLARDDSLRWLPNCRGSSQCNSTRLILPLSYEVHSLRGLFISMHHSLPLPFFSCAILLAPSLSPLPHFYHNKLSRRLHSAFGFHNLPTQHFASFDSNVNGASMTYHASQQSTQRSSWLYLWIDCSDWRLAKVSHLLAIWVPPASCSHSATEPWEVHCDKTQEDPSSRQAIKRGDVKWVTSEEVGTLTPARSRTPEAE